jgi:hypothetical protein
MSDAVDRYNLLLTKLFQQKKVVEVNSPMISRLICGAFVAIFLAGAFAPAQSSQKLNNLIVYGDGFAFGVREPDGWRGDTGKVAAKYQVNVVFLPPEESQNNDVTIRIRVNSKQDDNTAEDLNYDMQGYKKGFPKAQFSELNLAHAEYKTFARTVFVPGQFYEYVAYLNPGPGKRFIFSVAMSKKNEPATDGEFKAYEAILKSIVWLTSNTVEKR